jgi:hypothetical protein
MKVKGQEVVIRASVSEDNKSRKRGVVRVTVGNFFNSGGLSTMLTPTQARAVARRLNLEADKALR